ILFSTIADAFGMVIIECYRWGTVPIAASRGAIPELIEDGITGFLVPGKYGQTWPEVLAHSTKVGPGTDTYQRMVHAGWRKLHQLFNREDQLSLLSQLILGRHA
ncbi:MAG: glycosyltransferase, partial [Runella slithyformis]